MRASEFIFIAGPIIMGLFSRSSCAPLIEGVSSHLLPVAIDRPQSKAALSSIAERLAAAKQPVRHGFALKGTVMKHFGRVQSFNETTGHGFIHPEDGGPDVGFERGEILWDPIASPAHGVRLSYRLSGRIGREAAIDLQRVPVSPRASARKSFTIFRSAAEEAAARAGLEGWDNEGGHMSSTTGMVVSTPNAELPYKVILKHEGSPETERPFATMSECEAFIRRNTPRPHTGGTFRDQGPCAL
jgi:cold shock CspA family protein